MKLKISDNLSLPLEAATQTFAILAKRGMGKSFCAAVLAEEFLKAQIPVVIIDPTGAHWGLRAGANGGPGFQVVVFGGDHGDLPLDEHAGEVIAKAIVDNRFPAVIDLSLFRKGQLTRFMGAFAETLYRLNREALHLIVDEADAIAPQRPFGDEARTLGAMEDIVRRGRIRGLGCTLITQRPSVLNKNVLTQSESLFVFRMTHPRDIDAMMEWVDVHATKEESEQVRADLPILHVGTCYLWSPGWLQTLKKILVRARETFDSSATPKPGQSIKPPKELAAIDLSKLGDKIQEAARQAKENDPKELRRRLAELEKQLKARPTETKTEQVEVRVEVPVLKNGQLDRTEKVIARMEAEGERLKERSDQVIAEAQELRRLIAPASTPGPVRRPPIVPPPVSRPAQSVSPRREPTQPIEGELSGPEQRVLNELAELRSLGISPADKRQLGLLSGYTNVRSGGFTEPLAKLRDRGFVDYLTSGFVALTQSGTEAAGNIECPATTAALQDRILRKLDGPRARILREVIAAYPESVDKIELGAKLGYTNPRSGGFREPLGSLRELGLIDYPERGRVVAKSLLFVE